VVHSTKFVMLTLSAAQARRLAIHATGLGERRPTGRIDVRHLRKVLSRVHIVQLDSVNAVARAHELLFFSRLGPYDTSLIAKLAYDKRELYEAWLHEACLIPVDLWPALHWRRHHHWHAPVDQQIHDAVRDLLQAKGPLAASELDMGGRSEAWWGWSAGKRAVEQLFGNGEVGVVGRRRAFERVYDLIDRVLPPDVFARPLVPEHDARRLLLVEAARSLGVGTARDLVDYHRQKLADAKDALTSLVEDGSLEVVAVEGWKDHAYVVPGTTIPRRGCPGGRLVSPFDPLVWCRPRNIRLFDFTYTIEIYVPEPKRVYGYYVLPFLHGDRIAARVDVRSDRKAGVLRVHGAFAEEGVDHEATAHALAAELRLLASWQGCGEVVVGRKGDLAPALASVASGGC
jgi:uncharacterized protein YcaQ